MYGKRRVTSEAHMQSRYQSPVCFLEEELDFASEQFLEAVLEREVVAVLFYFGDSVKSSHLFRSPWYKCEGELSFLVHPGYIKYNVKNL
jgi:hypothetical protein